MENFKPVIEELEKRKKEPLKKSVDRAISGMVKLLKALDVRAISPAEVDEHIKTLRNVLNEPLKATKINGVYNNIIRKIYKDHKLVAPDYYRNLWMVIGMTAFGMPIGVAIFAATGNAAFISIGLPMGMPIGMAIGMQMDKKAAAEGRALVFEE